MRFRGSSIPFVIVFALLILVAFGLRVYSLDSDAPHHLSVSQGLTTDGANTVYAGRNRTLFGQWSPEIEGFPAVQNSSRAMDWLSNVTFSMVGIGFWQAGYLAVALGLLTISVVAAFARRHFGNRVAILSALFLTFNYAFLFYNRIPVAYTLVGLVLAIILYAMGKGQNKPLFLVVAIILAIFGIVNVKIASIASLPMIIVGLSYLIYERYSSKGKFNRRVILLIAVLVLLALLFLFFGPSGNLFLSRLDERSVNFSYGIEENIRFLVVSLLEFGIYSAFFVRMMPLFILSFVYVIYRAANLVTRKRKKLPYSEILALSYLLGVTAMLLLSNQQPARHLILLIPPMSLISAMAIDRLLRVERLGTARNLGYILPIVVLLGLTYLSYQILVATFRMAMALRMGTDVGDYSIITPMPILHATLFAALIPGFIFTIIILAHLSGSGRWTNRVFTRRRIRYVLVLLVAILLLGDLIQYVMASKQIRQDLGEDIVLGGAYSAVLGLENDYPGVVFFEIPLRNPEYQQKVLDSGLTHLVMESASVFGDIPINDEEMRKNAPEFVEQLDLVKRYYVRGYTINVYKIEPDDTLGIEASR